MQLPVTVPVIGTLLVRRSAKKIARAARNGDPAAVRELCRILVNSDDGVIRETARSALSTLPSRETVDMFCNRVLDAGYVHPRLTEIALSRHYAPSGLPARALFYAATGQKDCLAAIDRSPRYPLLSEGYRLAGPLTRKNVLLATGRDADGMCPVLARALLGEPDTRDPGSWSRAEWETIITGLIHEEDWDTLWILLFSAPPSLAVRSLHALHDGGWKPPPADRHLFNDLIASLPSAWDFPHPKDPVQLTLACRDRQCLKLVFSRDGSLLAGSHADGTISVWQIAQGRLLASWSEGGGRAGDPVLLPDNSSLVSLDDRGIVRCRHIPGGAVRWSFDEPLHRITEMLLSANGEFLLAGEGNGGVVFLDCSTGDIAGGFEGYPSPVTALAAAPDGHSVACGHDDGTIRYRDRRTSADQRVSGSGDKVRALAFSDDGSLLFVLSEHAQPAVWDPAASGRVLTCAGFSGTPAAHAISTAGCITMVWDTGNILRLWRWDEPGPCAGIPFYNRRPGCCAISPDGGLCVAGCDDGTIRIFVSPGGRLVRDFRGHTRPVSACAISPDSSLVATASWDGTVTLRDLPTGEIRRTLQRPAGPVTGLGMTPAGAVLIAVTADGIARQYTRETGTLLCSIDLYIPSAKAIAISPDGKFLACAGSDATLRLWELATGSLVAGRDRLGTTLRSLTFSPDGSLLVSGGWDGLVRYWRVPDLHLAGKGRGHSSIVTCCAVTPDGSQVVTGSNDTSVRIWDIEAKRSSVVIRDTRKEVSACVILPGGSLVAAGSADGAIRVYRLPDGKTECTIPVIPGKITSLAGSPDGELVIAGYENGSLAFCSLTERRLIRILPVHTAAVSGIAFVPGVEHVATSGTDGMVRVTRLPWTKNLSQTRIDDMPCAYEETTGDNVAMRSQWTFLYRMLAGRFRGEIGICSPSHEAGPFDIQIAGR
ncbi:hypothetical protein [Methanoregula sp.]|uniref:hypothetical protein n=1 Tax=Methanoregula sp. TaxID=2052170 RepID=UPI003C70C371